ncbi:MAG: S8 family serine peptidase [Bacillota bacterium]
MKNRLTILICLIISSVAFAQAEITPRLVSLLNSSSADEYLHLLILLKDQPDLLQTGSDRKNSSNERSLSQAEKHFSFLTSLRENSEISQRNLLSVIEKKKEDLTVRQYQSFWIANIIAIEVKKEFVYELSLRDDIEIMDVDAPVKNEVITDIRADALRKTASSVEPGIKIINADKLWKLGITGKGRLVMNIDTGVDGDHPALKDKWRGRRVSAKQAWLDLKNNTSVPYDSVNHGTHTMGLSLGSSKLTGDTVGVALDAEWIASNALTGGNPHTSRTITAFQWAMDPDGNPSTTSDVPDVINCSWYDGDTTINYCDNNNIYKRVLDALEQAGIGVIFSAGNNGAKPQTISNPQNINTSLVNTFCVANIDGQKYLQGDLNPVYANSSRGPSICGGTGSLLIKPEVSAPGTYVRSSVPGGKYAEMPGTSMAAAYVSGAYALLKQSNPEKSAAEIKLALYYSAKDLGEPGEDNVYGMGLIDVFEAFKYLNPPDKTAPTKISDLSVSLVTSNSLWLNWSAPLDSTMFGVRKYDLRYSTSAIKDLNDFNAALPVQLPDTPKSYGKSEKIKINGLAPNTTYYFAIRSVDLWDNWSEISNIPVQTTLKAPQVSLSRNLINKDILPGSSLKDTIVIRNSSPFASTLDYSVEFINKDYPVNQPELTAQRSGQQISNDSLKYVWYDNNNPKGPIYQWNDISSTGTEITNWTAVGPYDAKDEGYSGPVSIGFNFPFYNREYNQLFIAANGFITFEPFTAFTSTNAQIPASALPNGLIAPFWDDMEGRSPGKIYCKQEQGRFIIQYSNWSRRAANTGSLTSQVILTDKGKIYLYYNTIAQTNNSATVGIENQDGAKGIQIAFNQTYLKNNLAIEILPEPRWLTINNTFGTLQSNAQSAIELNYNLTSNGSYSGDLIIRTNDLVNPVLTIPVTLNVSNLVSVPRGVVNPVEFSLSQNYPNPFNPETVIYYSVPEKSAVTLKVYDLLGREISSLVNEVKEKGSYKTVFNASGLSSGAYIYRLTAGNNSVSRKMTVIK